MIQVLTLSLLLLIGLVSSQLLPYLPNDTYQLIKDYDQYIMLIGLSFIMIKVGLEFEINKSKLSTYGKDYLIAMTTATFPWILTSLYFLWIMLPNGSFYHWDTWKEILVLSRFTAPTSAGILFSMLAAAGLAATWVFKKARILAIFDDLDTVLLMIPLSMLIVGPKWEALLIIVIMSVLVFIAWKFLHQFKLKITWYAIIAYSIIIVTLTESLYFITKEYNVPIHIEVLLPAFVLGCIIKADHSLLEQKNEIKISFIISSIFIFFVGLSMPSLFTNNTLEIKATIISSVPPMSGYEIAIHVLFITILSNLGKMFPLFVYQNEATLKERLALSIGMWPRGEVGAGIIIISMSYGFGGPLLTVAILSLSLNLVLTGLFIVMVKKLLDK